MIPEEMQAFAAIIWWAVKDAVAPLAEKIESLLSNDTKQMSESEAEAFIPKETFLYYIRKQINSDIAWNYTMWLSEQWPDNNTTFKNKKSAEAYLIKNIWWSYIKQWYSIVSRLVYEEN